MTDILGQKFTFNSTLTRIVSLDPSATAVLYALGAYKDVVATGSYDYYPPGGNAPVICNDFTVNNEKLVSLNPQAVLGYGATVPSYGCESGHVEDIYKMSILHFIIDKCIYS